MSYGPNGKFCDSRFSFVFFGMSFVLSLHLEGALVFKIFSVVPKRIGISFGSGVFGTLIREVGTIDLLPSD